jgi:sigma-B regulation protein RsbU (phosphoserine phosphatase)
LKTTASFLPDHLPRGAPVRPDGLRAASEPHRPTVAGHADADTVRRIATRADGAANTPSTARITDGQIRAILDLSRMLAVPSDVGTMLAQIAQTCTELLDCERASIFLQDPETKELWTKVALGSDEIRLPSTAGIVGAAFTHNAVVHVADPYRDPRFNPEPDRRTGFVTRNLLSAPMADLTGKPMGVVQAVNKRGGAFGDKGGAFSDNDTALIRLLSEQAGVALQRHGLELQAKDAVALRHEMNLARRTQEALTPKHPPEVPGLICCGWTLPASVTGGDCYDLWRLPDGRLGILVADASGHGIGPALVVSQARTLVRALSDLMADPHEILSHVNTRLAEDLDWGQFVTAFLGFLSSDGVLHWSSAGHGPLLARRSPDAPLEQLEPPVQPLGVVLKWFDPGPPPVQLEPGGQLIVVTDGIFEASCDDRAAGDQMGIERMSAVVDEHRHGPDAPAAMLAALRREAEVWYATDEPHDDQTVVIVQVGGAGDSGVAPR